MKIPLEHFSATPVISLSPCVDTNLDVARRATISAGSAPSSPNRSRKTGTIMSNLATIQPMSSSLTSFDRAEVDEEYAEEKPKKTSMFQRFSASRMSHRVTTTSAPDQDQGLQRQICMDCKEMVLQVVRAQSTAKRLQMAKSIFQQQLLTKTNIA